MLWNGQLIQLEMSSNCGDQCVIIKFSGYINCKIFQIVLLRCSLSGCSLLHYILVRYLCQCVKNNQIQGCLLVYWGLLGFSGVGVLHRLRIIQIRFFSGLYYPRVCTQCRVLKLSGEKPHQKYRCLQSKIQWNTK